MMKNILYAALFCVTPLVSYAQELALIDKVVAMIGGEIILLSEVEEQVAYAKQNQPGIPPDFNCIALQNVMVQKMLVNRAKIDSVEVSDEEVDGQLDDRVNRLLGYFNQDEKALEEYYGQTVADIKYQMRNDLRDQLLAERMRNQITEKATVTPTEVREFFANIPKDSLPYFNAEVEIKELVYKPQVNGIEKAKARQRIDDLRQRISEGEDFAELAKKYSDDTGSAVQGGDLGWQKRGTFVSAFEAMCYKLEANQLSPVVETEFGFHIIQLLERRGNLVHARHILIKPEITEADLDLAKAHLDSIRTMIVKDSLPFGTAVKRFGDKDTQSFNNDGRVTNPRSGNTFYEVADLDTDIFFAIDGLPVGGVTAPTPFRAPDGSKYFRLIQLVSRSKPHRADLKLDYNKIQTAAVEQKKAYAMEKWVIDELRSTFLSIDAIYGECPNLQDMLRLSEGQ